MRIVRLRLGDEALELIEYLAPRRRPLPAHSRGNDRWSQHLAIVVKDMDRAPTGARGTTGLPIPRPRRSLLDALVGKYGVPYDAANRATRTSILSEGDPRNTWNTMPNCSFVAPVIV